MNTTVALDIAKLDQKRQQVISQLTAGINLLLSSYNIEVITGKASLATDTVIEVTTQNRNHITLMGERVIISTGSLPKFPFNSEGILSPEEALAIFPLTKSIAVIGGGVIGVELATMYRSLGCRVTIIEKQNDILTDFDKDIRQIVKLSLLYAKRVCIS